MNKKDGSLFVYVEVANHFLAKYATVEVIAETVSDIHSFTQDPSTFGDGVLGRTLDESSPLWTGVRGAYLKGLFTEGLQPSTRHSMRAYRRNDEEAFMHALARHAAFLLRLQARKTYAEYVDRQRQPNRGSRETSSPVLTVQSSGTASSRKSSESPC